MQYQATFSSHQVTVQAKSPLEAESKAFEWLKAHLTDTNGDQHLACLESITAGQWQETAPLHRGTE